MPRDIVECIPNFSEARRAEVVEALMQAVVCVEGAYLLDRHSDLDHNRTVLTFAGAPQAVEEAAYRSIAKAAELIDLNQHSGEHPRIGASDVVPFVPISGVSMQDCVEIARRVGRRVGEELGIPVYLYEEAATRPERRNLENIRKGQYEALKKEIATNPERAPDFGPLCVGPAGATVVGARQPLIAFNVYLSTEDVSIAKKIAKSIRQSSGGLHYVKALGLLVEGRAQVSMNLTNYRETPMARVVEMIRSEAARFGVTVQHSELVGLIPQEALMDAAVWHLQLDQFKPEQVLEWRLEAILREAEKPCESGIEPKDFLEAMAAGTPTPGGGSASAYSGAAAAALVGMVARLTIGRKKYAESEPRMKTILEQAEELRFRLTAAIEQDAAAFQGVMAAYQMPKDNPEQAQKRMEAVEESTLRATRVPLEVARGAVKILALAGEVTAIGNIKAISDSATAAAQAQAALKGAGYNVRINAKNLKDRKAAKRMLDELIELEKNAETLEEQIRSTLIERGGMPIE